MWRAAFMLSLRNQTFNQPQCNLTKPQKQICNTKIISFVQFLLIQFTFFNQLYNKNSEQFPQYHFESFILDFKLKLLRYKKNSHYKHLALD